mmetsp:Transcript_15667/g.37616  ORF Transcript_15667/g.37616 Transcript_15667/m.37616 type:complete len:203 (+) Transcript_15667:3516-4124(+)
MNQILMMTSDRPAWALGPPQALVWEEQHRRIRILTMTLDRPAKAWERLHALVWRAPHRKSRILMTPWDLMVAMVWESRALIWEEPHRNYQILRTPLRYLMWAAQCELQVSVSKVPCHTNQILTRTHQTVPAPLDSRTGRQPTSQVPPPPHPHMRDRQFAKECAWTGSPSRNGPAPLKRAAQKTTGLVFLVSTSSTAWDPCKS